MKKIIIEIMICLILIGASINLGISTNTIFDDPIVTITNPDDGAIFDNPNIEVMGNVMGMGIKRIEYEILYAGGGIYGNSFDIDPPVEYYEFSIDFVIVEGSDGNLITITAVDVENNEGSDSVTVYYEPSGDDTEPPVVVITYPSDGDEFNESDIYITTVGTDNIGIIGYGIFHEWEEGSEDTGLIEFTNPLEYVEINESILLREGWNNIEVYMDDLSSNRGWLFSKNAHSLSGRCSVSITLP